MKICIIGAFGFDMLDQTTGGQPVKTRQLFGLLASFYGKENVSYIETYNWRSHPLQLLIKVLGEAKRNEVMIMLPAHNGVHIFARVLTMCRKLFRLRIHYDVIGGWLPDVSEKNALLQKKLKSFDGIWVETTSMKEKMDAQGYENVTVVPNFKDLPSVEIKNNSQLNAPPYLVCTFSRVTEKKGITDAINAVTEVNRKAGKVVYRLDIYGPIDEAYRNEFEKLLSVHAEHVRYCGVVSPDHSTQVLKEYYALLFPTKYFTEGVPGTLIDAYSAGVPVISAMWMNYKDIFIEGVTGWGYEFDNYSQFVELLEKASVHSEDFLRMKETCSLEADKYHPNSAMKIIRGLLEE